MQLMLRMCCLPRAKKNYNSYFVPGQAQAVSYSNVNAWEIDPVEVASPQRANHRHFSVIRLVRRVHREWRGFADLPKIPGERTTRR